MDGWETNGIDCEAFEASDWLVIGELKGPAFPCCPMKLLLNCDAWLVGDWDIFGADPPGWEKLVTADNCPVGVWGVTFEGKAAVDPVGMKFPLFICPLYPFWELEDPSWECNPPYIPPDCAGCPTWEAKGGWICWPVDVENACWPVWDEKGCCAYWLEGDEKDGTGPGWLLGAEKGCWENWSVGTGKVCAGWLVAAEKPFGVNWPVGSENGCDAIWPDEAGREGNEEWPKPGAEMFCCELISGNGAGGRISARISVSSCADDTSWDRNWELVEKGWVSEAGAVYGTTENESPNPKFVSTLRAFDWDGSILWYVTGWDGAVSVEVKALNGPSPNGSSKDCKKSTNKYIILTKCDGQRDWFKLHDADVLKRLFKAMLWDRWHTCYTKKEKYDIKLTSSQL